MYKKYIFKVSHLTPIHIGTGEVMTLFDYSVEIDNKNYYCYVLNNEEIFNSFSINEKESFFKLINNNQITTIRKELNEKFKKLIKENKGYIYRVNTDEKFYKYYCSSIENNNIRCLVNLFPRTGLRPYIPGSSIKGALRTIILNKIFDKDEDKFKEAKNKLKNHNKDYKLVEGVALNAIKNEKFDIEKDPFKHLFVSDVLLDNEENIYVKKLEFYSLRMDKKLEYKSNLELNFELTDFKNKRLEIVIQDNNQLTFEEKYGKLEEILMFSNKHIKQIIQFECERLFYAKECTFDKEKQSKIIKNYDGIVDTINNFDKKSFVLRLGRGSGYDAMTIKKLRDKPDPENAPPSKGWGYSKILCDFKPLGLMKLELEKVETIK